ncbi:MAG: DR2241 family protein [Akkermansiaceae bacterium]|nr:DR2241 family protein [Akkermansiaceae bacterium]
MSLSQQLLELIRKGRRHIGEILIMDLADDGFLLCHHLDADEAASDGHGKLEVHHSADVARAISTYDAEGEYRFAKAQVNLKRGWAILLPNERELLRALDLFYPAGVGIFLAHQDGSLEIEHMRDKLNRQTGMYKFARNISDEGAQALIKDLCGPAHQCARRILWQIDENTPLENSEASRYKGICAGSESEAIPLMCREACNHFVAQARKVSKQEFEAAQGTRKKN